MTPYRVFPGLPPRSIIRKSWRNYVRIDTDVLYDWGMRAASGKLIAVAAGVILLAGSFPLILPSQAQDADLRYEIQHLQEEIKELRPVPLEIALMQQQLVEQVQWHKEQQERDATLLHAFLGVIGGVATLVIGWILHQLGVTGITFGNKKESA